MWMEEQADKKGYDSSWGINPKLYIQCTEFTKYYNVWFIKTDQQGLQNELTDLQ